MIGLTNDHWFSHCLVHYTFYLSPKPTFAMHVLTLQAGFTLFGLPYTLSVDFPMLFGLHHTSLTVRNVILCKSIKLFST